MRCALVSHLMYAAKVLSVMSNATMLLTRANCSRTSEYFGSTGRERRNAEYRTQREFYRLRNIWQPACQRVRHA